MLGEIVHGVQIALEYPRELVPSQIQEAQVVQTRQIKMQRGQRVIAEIKIQEIRQIAEHVDISELRDLVLFQMELYQLREIAGRIRQPLSIPS